MNPDPLGEQPVLLTVEPAYSCAPVFSVVLLGFGQLMWRRKAFEERIGLALFSYLPLGVFSLLIISQD